MLMSTDARGISTFCTPGVLGLSLRRVSRNEYDTSPRRGIDAASIAGRPRPPRAPAAAVHSIR
eukprot:COSAG02_NODE_50912_length_317_cov_1.082569_1_plen_62_part_01